MQGGGGTESQPLQGPFFEPVGNGAWLAAVTSSVACLPGDHGQLTAGRLHRGPWGLGEGLGPRSVDVQGAGGKQSVSSGLLASVSESVAWDTDPDLHPGPPSTLSHPAAG